MADRVTNRLTIGDIEMKAIVRPYGLFIRVMEGCNHVVDIEWDTAKVLADFVRATEAVNPNG